MKPSIGDVMLYTNNAEPPRPFLVSHVHADDIVSGSVNYEHMWGYRSAVRVQKPDQPNAYPHGEYVFWSEKQIAFERKYPLNPDL